MANQRSAVATQPEQAWGAAQEDEHIYVKGRKLAFIMISVLLGILLAALDQTVVGPAMPKIIGDLKGFEYYSWVFTVYLLTSTITVPIFGKLSDMYGRKWFYIAGILVFLLGSVLSGLSQDIAQLIIFRGLQGLGAGIIMANAFAIIADLIPPADRGKWQGAFGSVFGLASVIGPTVGGFLTDNLNWRWVFYVNVPVGLVALAVLLATFPHEVKHSVRKIIDWAGAFTLTAGLTPLLLALSLGGTRGELTIPFFGRLSGWEWTSPKIVGLLAIAAFFLVAFIFVESRAREAIIPLDLFKNRIFLVSVITVFVTGVGLFGAVLYIPLFVQAIQGDSATNSGNAITPMTMAIVLSSIITGQIISRTGKYRIVGVLGMAAVTLGMFLLYTMNMNTERLVTVGYMVIMGLGLGVAFPLYTLVVQNAYPIQRVGVTTAAVQFFRSIGSTMGVAILGSVVNNQFHDKFGPAFTAQVSAQGIPIPPEFADRILTGLGDLNPQVLVGSEGAARLHTQLTQFVPAQFASSIPKIEQAITDAMRPSLFSGIQEAFLIGTVLLGIGLVTTIFLKEIPLRKSNRGGPGGPGGPGGSAGNGRGPGGLATLAEGYEPMAEEAGREMAASGMPGATTIPARDEPRLARK